MYKLYTYKREDNSASMHLISIIEDIKLGMSIVW